MSVGIAHESGRPNWVIGNAAAAEIRPGFRHDQGLPKDFSERRTLAEPPLVGGWLAPDLRPLLGANQALPVPLDGLGSCCCGEMAQAGPLPGMRV